jgi:drug/metabolite transporter (DMT)-like permease
MAVLLGLCAAITYGAADFVGGLVTKRASAFWVVLISQAIGAPAILLMLPLFGGEPSRAALLWGAASGIGGGAGVLLLYRGLSIGRMAVVAPITAVLAAAVPVVFGLATGERPAPLSLVGVGLGFVAVALISGAPDGSGAGRVRNGVPQALGAGVFFGLFFITLDRAPEGSGMWPLLGARISALVLVGALILVTRASLKREPGTLRAIAAAGALDVLANAFYLSATRRGLLSLVAVLTSLYPATTILLARVFLSERLALLQVAGLLVGAGAVVLIAVG